MKQQQRYLQGILDTLPLTMQEILDARECRVQRQQKLMADGGTLISFTMNIAGAVKRSPLFSSAFAEGKRRILRQLAYENAAVLAQEAYNGPTGEELYLLVDTDITTVKRRMVEIEDGFAMGRLFDIDVMSAAVPKVSRRDLELEPRKCLLCGNQAAACARSRAHNVESLLKKTVEMIWEYFVGEYADHIAQTACRALLYEVTVAPKPGLVDRENTGSHHDMDQFTFIDSACALYPYFRRCAIAGIKMQEDVPHLFGHLRYLGKEAEEQMCVATSGINTHKGAIFSMGIFCAAAGVLSEDISPEPYFPGNMVPPQGLHKKFSRICQEMCAQLLDDFAGVEQKVRLSYGERLYQEYAVTGIRGEAARGFPSVFRVGLPMLQAELDRGKTVNDAGVAALLALIAQVQDTNIIARSDMDTLHWTQQRAGQVLAGGIKMEQVRALNEEFVQRNISPGGCADLLALCYFCLALQIVPQEDKLLFPGK